MDSNESIVSIKRDNSRDQSVGINQLRHMSRLLPTLNNVEGFLKWEDRQKQKEQGGAARYSLFLEESFDVGVVSAASSLKEEEIKDEGEEEIVEEEHVPETKKPEEKPPEEEEQEEEVLELLEAIIEEGEEESEAEEPAGDEDEDAEKEKEEDMYLTFEEDKSKVVISVVSVQKIESLKEEEDIYDPAPLFVEIMERVMAKTEYLDVPTKLQRTLSHHKIINAIKIEWQSIMAKQKRQYLLNCKIVEHLRKKKTLRALRDDNPETIRKVIKKFRSNIRQLEVIRTKHANLIQTINSRLFAAKNKEQLLALSCAENIIVLQALIREYGGKSMNSTGQPLPSKVVENIIRRIEKIQSTIIKWRVDLIQQQDRVSCLSDLVVRLDKLENGLNINDYEQLKCETSSLTEKIEERNNELAKLRAKAAAETHTAAHCREKQNIFACQIEKSQKEYDIIREKYLTKKNVLHSLRIERGKLRIQYNELSFNCGLLDKPKLLIDYDKTADLRNLLEKQIEKINNGSKKLEAQLQAVEHQLKKKI